MDRLLVALLNTAVQEPDPLETALSAARWWSTMNAPDPPGVTVEGKPRFDAALAGALRGLRDSVRTAAEGGTATIRFTGTAADRVIFRLAAAALDAFGSRRSPRIKHCAGADCALYFFDATKNGSRRWCSLRCMEKSRVPRRRTIPA
ncbi:MAG TPA: CGNR zinc finger domain-containing protein [Candidatus Baltobacteraceae bacterium]|nr:CGNR zinc finger domain-containing protein [Candidatus Baltobacteraceae bacterium]